MKTDENQVNMKMKISHLLEYPSCLLTEDILDLYLLLLQHLRNLLIKD